MSVLLAASLASAGPQPQDGAPKPAPASSPTPPPSRCAGIPPDPFGYRCDDTITRPWITATWPVDWSAGVAILPIGFTFEFYGSGYTQVAADMNGNLQFTTDTPLYTNACPLPAPSLGKLIAPFWDDLYPAEGGAGYYSITGAAPNRIFTVVWRDLSHWPGSPSGVTFEVQLEETTNDIYFLYRDVDFGDPQWNSGASASAGIQNDSGALQYSCNEPALTAGRMIRIYREVTPTPTAIPLSGLAPVADAYTSQSDPNTPYGAVDPDWLQMQGSRGPSGVCATTRSSLLKFDVSILSRDVTTASLGLQYTQYTGPASGVTLGLWPIDDNWDELTVTWNTQPISSGPPLSTRSSPMPPTLSPLVFPGSAALVNYVNSQRPANGGDGLASFMIGYVGCPPISAPQLRGAAREHPINLPPRLMLDLYRLYLPLILN